MWNILQSHSRFTTSVEIPWGTAGDVPVPGDYDGDGKTDLAVFHPATGQWQILLSSTNYTTSLTLTWGTSTDIPVPGDYDGDGKTDLAYNRPSTGRWQILTSSSQLHVTVAGVWGTSTDIPVPGDYDGDGKTDLGDLQSGHGAVADSAVELQLHDQHHDRGHSVDIPVPGDYDGDREDGISPSSPPDEPEAGICSKMNYTTSMAILWGSSGGDLPVVGDYDGDGKADLAVFTPSGWAIFHRTRITPRACLDRRARHPTGLFLFSREARPVRLVRSGTRVVALPQTASFFSAKAVAGRVAQFVSHGFLCTNGSRRSPSSFRRQPLIAITSRTLTSIGGSVNVVTYHNDNARTGQNLNETILTPATVNTSTVRQDRILSGGRQSGRPAAVLVRRGDPGLGTRDVLYVVTEHDSVYAFDAASGGVLWHVSCSARARPRATRGAARR